MRKNERSERRKARLQVLALEERERRERTISCESESEEQVARSWQQIAGDLAQAAAEAGESRIHVEDLADAISCHLGERLEVPAGCELDRFGLILRAIRRRISMGRQWVRF